MQLTALIAKNRQDASLAITQDNLPAIGIYIAEAITEAENELRRHIKNSSKFSLYRNDNAIVLNLKDRLRVSDGTVNQIHSTLELYVMHYIISRWTENIASVADFAENYKNSAAGYIASLTSLVCMRNPYTTDPGAYKIRERDVQPTREENDWAKYVAVSSDPALVTDKENNIIVAKPE